MPSEGAQTTDRQWGDFQTPLPLALAVCRFLASLGCAPTQLLEPTCGEGSFIRAALHAFPGLRQVYGIEIQPGYAAATQRLFADRPWVTIQQGDIFSAELPFQTATETDELLVLGNPPWVTNAALARLGSANLPTKTNLKGHSGLEARTGKANFDLAESIVLRLLERFQHRRGYLAMLCKNQVVRGLVEVLPKRGLHLAEIRALGIDARRHFGASVEAALLVVRLGMAGGAPTGEAATRTEPNRSAHPELPVRDIRCQVSSLETPEAVTRAFGWVDGRFVADVDAYARWRTLDGTSPFIWRQGLKHDCARVMELTGDHGSYRNRLGEIVELEPDFVYPLLKSADLKGFAAAPCRLSVPVTQRIIGQETAHLATAAPRLWAYLTQHRDAFAQRRSSIYRGQPPFALFGIGPYSFSPYKVAISGLYKEGQFALVEPVGGRPVMLDDTCYFLGFDRHADALLTCAALNSGPVRGLLRALVFRDAKRPYTKDLLMRIDLRQVFAQLRWSDLQQVWLEAEYIPTRAVRESDLADLKERL